MAKKDTKVTERVKRSGKVWGAFYEKKDGTPLYLAWRKLSDMECGAFKSLGEAVRNHVAAWPIEEDILMTVRARGIRYIGIKVRETNDIYLTKIDHFFNRETFTVPPRRFGRTAPMRAVIIDKFRMKAGKLKL